MLRVEEGSLYPALHRLEESRLVKARWVVTAKNRRARRLRHHRRRPTAARGRGAALAEGDAGGRTVASADLIAPRSTPVAQPFRAAIGGPRCPGCPDSSTCCARVVCRKTSTRSSAFISNPCRGTRADGLSREEALARASRQFGNRAVLRETSRDLKLVPWLESLWRDLRLGARMLRKDAGVSSVAVISLGLAIGACTAAFSLIDAVILRDLPVHDPDRLVYISRAGDNKDLRFAGLFSYPFLESMRQTLPPHMEVFSMSHQSLRQAILPDAGGVEEKLLTQFVSANAFAALGVAAAIGRVL